MDRTEFAQVMAYIAAAVGKELNAEAAEVYYDLLGDLPLSVLQLAAKLVVLEHRWANFPTVAELRSAAAETMWGQVSALSPSEAWALAWQAVGRMDPEIPSTVEKAFASLPPLVVEAIRAFGLNALCYGDEPVGVVRGQFLRIFEQLQSRERRQALLPSAVQEQIRSIGPAPKELPSRVRKMLENVGCEDG